MTSLMLLGASVLLFDPAAAVQSQSTLSGQEMAAMCSLAGERQGRQFKTCYYTCEGGGSFSMTITAREICPFVQNR